MTAYRQAELTAQQIAACGTWQSEAGQMFLELYQVIPWYFLVNAGALVENQEQAISPEYDFVCRQIGCLCPGWSPIVKIRWPDGRSLSNPGLPLFDIIGTGRDALLLEAPELLARGQKIRLDIDNTVAHSVQTNIQLFFEGWLRIPMVQS